MDVVKRGQHWHYQASFEELERWLRYGFVSDQGIIYDEELAGPNGMDFILFPATWHTREDIEKTKNWLRDTRDVVRIIVGLPTGRYPLSKKSMRDHTPWSPEDKEKAFRQIDTTKLATTVDNVLLMDIVSARAVVAVMDALSPENKEKYLKYPAHKMVELAFELCK